MTCHAVNERAVLMGGETSQIARMTDRIHAKFMTRKWLREFAALPRPELPRDLVRLIDAHDWEGAHAIATRSNRISVVIEMLATRPVFETWPRVLALSIAGGDYPRREYARLCSILRLLHDLDLRVFDKDASRHALESLPAQVAVFRGTVQAELESKQFGVCWSLDRNLAQRFALRSAIAREIVALVERPDVARELVPDGFDSPAVVLTATVNREDIAGMLTACGELEVLICPHKLKKVQQIQTEIDEITDGDGRAEAQR